MDFDWNFAAIGIPRSRRIRLAIAAMFGFFAPSFAAAPTVSTLFPADGATGVSSKRPPLQLKFGASVSAGTGNIVIKKSSDNGIVESIPITSSQVSFGGAAMLHGFESSIEEWTGGQATYSQSNTRAHAGTYSLKAITTGTWQQAGSVYDSLGLNLTNFDSVVVWVYSTQAGGTANVYTKSGSAATWNNLNINNALTQNAWTRVSAPLIACSYPANVNGIGLNLSLAGTYWIDDVGLVKSGNTYVNILPSLDLPFESNFYVNIDAGAIKDVSSGTSYAGISDPTTWNFSTNPGISALNPPDNATLIGGRQAFQIQFGRPVARGAGNIVFKNSADNSVFESIPVTSSQVSFGDTALFNGFESSVEDWGIWGAATRIWDNSRAHTGTGALKATTAGVWSQVEGRFSSQNWSAFDSIVCWVYTTTASSNVVGFTRSGSLDKWNDATTAVGGVALTQNGWTRIAAAISTAYDRTRVQSFGLNFSVAGTYWVDDVSLMKSGASFVSVVPSKNFAVESGYYVNIDAGAIKAVSNATSYAGISDATTWSFTTDHNPTDIQLSSTSVSENLVAHSVVALLSATDPDAGEGFDYQLVPGTGSTDNASFAHVTNHDTLFTADTFDYEKKSSYSIRLLAMDRRGGGFEKIFTINILNASDRLKWDNSTTAGTQTGSGTWGTNNYWSYNGTDLLPWPGSGHAAEFAGADGSYTITVNGTQSADSVIFTNKGYTLTGGTLAMTGSAPTIVANAKGTIASALSGPFATTGSDTLTLSGNNSAAQPYTHLGGAVIAASNNALGAGAATINGPGQILLGNGVDLGNTFTVTSCDPSPGNGAIAATSGNSGSLSGSIVVNGTCATGGLFAGSSDGSGILTLTGPVGGSAPMSQRNGIVVYKGGGTSTKFRLIQGTARLGIANGLPTSAYISFGNSGPMVLDLFGYNQSLTGIAAAGNSPTATITNSQGAASILTVNGSADTVFAGSITGNLTLTKSGTSRQTLSGSNTYLGSTNVNGGTLVLKNANAIGSTSAVNVGSGGSLDLGGQTIATSANLTLNGTGVSASGALTNSGATAATYPALVTLGGATSIIAASGDINLSNTGSINGGGLDLTLGGAANGNIAGVLATTSGALIKQDSGTWTIANSSTRTGPTTITNGTLAINNATALGTGSLTINGGKLSVLVNGAGNNGTINTGLAVFTNSNNTATINVGNNGSNTGNTVTFGTCTAGAATVNVTGSNGYGVQFTSLYMGGNNAGPIVLNPTTANLSIGTVTTSSTAARVLQLDGTSTGNTITGNIADNSLTATVVKSNTGTWTLSGTNTYTGTTTISGGTLMVTGSLASGSAVTIASGGTLSGSGTVSGSVNVNGGAIAPGLVATKGILNTGRVDFSTGTGSNLKIRLANFTTAGTDFDRLKSSDTVVLGGNSVLNVDLSGITGTGTATGIVQATAIKGKFANVVATNATGYSVGLVYKTNSIDLVVLPTGTAKLTWDNSATAGFQASSGTWGVDNFWSDNGTRLFPWPSNGFTSEFAGADGNYTITVNGTQIADSMSFLNSGYTLTQGALTLGKGIRVAAGKTDTIDQTLITAPTLTLTGGGTLVVRNSNAQPFGDLNIVDGTYVASRTGGATGDKLGTGTVTVSNGATLVMDRLLQGDTYANPLFLSGSGTGKGALQFQNNMYGITFNSPITLQADTRIGSSTSGRSVANDFVSLGGTISGPFNLTLSAYHGILRSTGIISIAGNLTIDTSDTVMLYKANTYTGNTIVSNGTLRSGADEVIPNGTGKGNLSVTGIFDLNGFSETINGLTGSGTIDDFSSTASVLTVGDNDQTSTFGGAIRSTKGTLGLTKIGTGALTLSGNNPYKGVTNVNAGTLDVTGGIDSTSQVNVATGGTLCGTGSIGGTIVGNGGAIQPGTTSSIGVMDAHRIDLSGSTASTLKIRIKATSKPGIEYDRIILSDTLILGGNSTLELDLTGLTEIGSASGIVMAGGIVGTFKTVKILNYTGTVGAIVSYRSTSIKVVFNNLAPSFTAGANQTVREDTSAQSLAGWATGITAGSPEESGQALAFVVTTTNDSLFSTKPTLSATGTLAYIPAANRSGVATVSVQLRDNGGTTSGGIDSTAVQTFTITVLAVNDAPSFVKGANQSILVGSGAQTVANWATAISAGPADESSQKLSFRVSNNANVLFSSLPSISSIGTLTYTPATNANGTATVHLRLGDDGGTANGGIDSSAIDSFTIQIHAPLSVKIRPDTLRMRPGDTASFRIAAKNGSGADTTIDLSGFNWSWNPSLGFLWQGHVGATKTGTSTVRASGLGMTDSVTLVVAALDTTLPSSKDSTSINAGHGVVVIIPPHDTSTKIGVDITDSTLGGGIAGADTAVGLTGSKGSTDSVVLKVPVALVPLDQVKLHGTPMAYWIDSIGKIHSVPTKLLPDSSLWFVGLVGRTYWLGYDTLAPTTGSKVTGDSVSTGSNQHVDWTVSDNVASTRTYFCILKAGQSAPACSLVVASDSTHGSLVVSPLTLPLGGRVWMESRDGFNTTRSQQMDIVVKIDTLRAPSARQEDRYDMISFPYSSGRGSAHANFKRMWGADNAKRWRAFTVDTASKDFAEILSGDTLDASGRSFWVRTRKVDLVPWIAGGWTPPVSIPVKVALRPGWNAVGNPLGFDVDWKQVKKLSGLDTQAVFGPYKFDGTAQSWTIPDTTIMWSAWSGIAILNSTGRTVSLSVPSIASGAFSPRVQGSIAPFRIGLRGSQGSDTALRIWMGIDTTLKSGWNKFDHPLPPSPTAALRVFLPPPTGSVANVPFFTDIRPRTDSGAVWTIHVTGLNSKTPLVLELAKSGADTSIPLWVRDDKSARWLPAAARMEFAVGNESTRDFQVLAGPAPKSLNTVRRFGLENHGRALAWSLPDEMGRSRVRIEVLDMLGRKTATLLDETQDPGTYVREFAMPHSLAQQLVHITAGGRQATMIRLRTR